MSEIKNTTKIQLASLDAFCNALGYQYNGKYFENDEGNKVKFSRMADLHNGRLFYSTWVNLTKREGRSVRIGDQYIRVGDVYEAEKNKLVEQIYLQQKKNGVIVTQQYMIKLCS